MPPGPVPYPFLGNIPQIISADPIRPFDKLSEKYGDIFTVTFPSGNAVILNTASLVREARLAPGRQEDLMGKSPESIYPLKEIVGGTFSARDYSDAYLFEKKVFVSAMHIFGAGIGQASVRAGHAVDIAMEEIENEPGKSFSPKNLLESSIVVQLWEWLTAKKIALDDPIVKESNEFNAIFSRQALLSTMYQLFPFLCYLPTQLTREIKRAVQIRETIFPMEYRAHQESYIPGTIRDLTDSFISAYEKELAKETRKDIGSKDSIPGLMLNVIYVGSSTTSTWLTWFFLYMVLYPNVQSKIHEELDEVVGRDRLPNWKDAKSFPYLQATLCEVGRASGMTTVVGTNTIRDTTIAGYPIPKGTFVGLNLTKLHKDEREWPEPEKFKPERFLDEDGKFVGWNKLHGFMPFSVGRRECPGQSLARVMMLSFASILLHRYKIELPEGAEVPTTKVSTPQLIVQPDDFLVVAKPRELKLQD
ncbi:steroid 17-alpha-hydroxylase 17,20 lyase-like [Paramuricea clavata]|uniref:Steroid 17-alpha-hydroxylase 17,20 lyase-like n=1 Tax=Paramuricea clavata TaxID=317549 RepID=A0A7D9KY57_PARCT|nr:steroid 17-alpha-hydroxylase 17,20 lyase-like [Paramuricea clavata]CAB4022790.1 steroid 17-alpha-hydroxylase 17,20 lyase-like [Paramuricea clavata]